MKPIPVTERLPEMQPNALSDVKSYSKVVLAFDAEWGQWIFAMLHIWPSGKYWKTVARGVSIGDCVTLEYVTHWMPLPPDPTVSPTGSH
jgi:hypothetical protein